MACSGSNSLWRQCNISVNAVSSLYLRFELALDSPGGLAKDSDHKDSPLEFQIQYFWSEVNLHVWKFSSDDDGEDNNQFLP